MRPARLAAADEGVQRLDAVHQAVFHQEFERAVDRRRLGAAAFEAQLLENIVGAHGLVPAPDQLEHPAAQLGQAQVAPRAKFARRRNRRCDAAVVVVAVNLEGAEDGVRNVGLLGSSSSGRGRNGMLFLMIVAGFLHRVHGASRYRETTYSAQMALPR